jgi:hypothetical protein
MSARTARIAMAAAVLAASGVLTVTFVSSGGKGTADAATELNQFVAIQNVRPNVRNPTPGAQASNGSFTVDCGTNGNGKFSPDNPVAQPGIKNGAEHLHDFIGNLAITTNSSNADLDASGTTCRNGDKSSYFWPVVRIDKSVRSGAEAQRALAGTTPMVTCPSVRNRLPAVPAAAKRAVDNRLAALDRGYAAANERMATSKGRVDARLNSTVLADLRQQRAELIKGISDSIAAAGGGRTSGMVSLVECDTNYDGMHAAMRHTAASLKAGLDASSQIQCPTVRDKLPGVPARAVDEVNRNLTELDRQISEANERLITTRGQGGKNFVDNAILGPLKATGGIVRPASVLIQYRGNPTSKVVPMPKFLRALTGDAKPTSRGPANARATWTCSGFTDRLSDKYPICPAGSQVQRVQDFPGCWDGKNIDSTNHRDHLAFADAATGACKQGFVAIPQLRITISYDIPRDVQAKGQFALDSFPEEDHNPFSDHNDFINVNSAQTMKKIATCINKGKTCR